MAITGTFNPSLGFISVIADLNANSVTVSRDAGGNILVNGGAVAVSGGSPTVANTSLIRIFGEAGNDSLTLNEANGALTSAYLFGGLGNDTMTGGSGADILFGEGDNDTLLGKGGADSLFGGAGNDSLTGGDANDQLFGEDGNDRLIWNPGDDSDLFEGGAGIDTAEVNGGNGAEEFSVGVDGERVAFKRINPAPFSIDIGTTERLVINANSGADTITLSGNPATLMTITLNGGAGNDTLTGGNGKDTLDGGSDVDALAGGANSDTYVLGAEASGTDTVTDTSGIDAITSTINRSLAFADYSEIENLILLAGSAATGNALKNTITGNSTANTLNGLTNFDRLVGGASSDSYFVDKTIDAVIELAGAAAGTADRVYFTGLANQTYSLTANVEKLILSGTTASRGTGNALNNVLAGNAAGNVLDGKHGNDTVTGGNGNDTLIGGFGIDTLTGGANNDFFVLNTPLSTANRDIITDFNRAADTFRLDNLFMTTLGGTGVLKSNFFFAGTAAHDADDHIIYNAAIGALYYDANGTGAGGATLLATLLNKPTLTFMDFVVI